MRIVGVKQREGRTLVGLLSSEGSQVQVIADVHTFWAAPAFHLAATPTGPTLSIRPSDLVPPVLGSARVICVGANYQDHIDEGSLKGQKLPAFPTLFARWPASLSSNGAEIPVPAGEDEAATLKMMSLRVPGLSHFFIRTVDRLPVLSFPLIDVENVLKTSPQARFLRVNIG